MTDTGDKKNGAGTILSAVMAVVSAAVIMLISTFAAGQVLDSQLVNQSRIISMIVAQDSVELEDFVGNKANVDMMLKFVGAITSAYIDFELIPINEVGTFTAVFESMQKGITIEKFEYHRKNLTITGTADSQQEYGQFLTRLRDTEYFARVSGHFYTTPADTIHFELECVSRSADVYLDFGETGLFAKPWW